MLCREYYYDLDDELKSWDRGKICVGDWIQDHCEDGRSEFMLMNNNYNITNYDYSYSQRCISIEDSYSGAHSLAATFLAALTALVLFN